MVANLHIQTTVIAHLLYEINIQQVSIRNKQRTSVLVGIDLTTWTTATQCY